MIIFFPFNRTNWKWIRTEMKLVFPLLCWHIEKSVSITMEHLKLCAYQNTAIVSEWERRMRMRDQYQSIPESINAIHQCCFKSLLFCLWLLNTTEWLVTKWLWNKEGSKSNGNFVFISLWHLIFNKRKKENFNFHSCRGKHGKSLRNAKRISNLST